VTDASRAPGEAFEAAALEYLETSARHLAALVSPETAAAAARAGHVLAEALQGGGKVLFCGNGGSAADAQHLAAELVGRLSGDRDREPLAAISLTTDASILTALSNDYGYPDVFARQVMALGRPGDALVAISTSGRSENVLRAARIAAEGGMRVVGLAGPDLSPLDDLVDICLHAPGETSGLVQQGHITLGHLLCALAERAILDEES